MNELTPRQMELLIAVTSRSAEVSEQMLIIGSAALRLGASDEDVQTIRATLLAGHTRDCGQDWSHRS